MLLLGFQDVAVEGDPEHVDGGGDAFDVAGVLGEADQAVELAFEPGGQDRADLDGRLSGVLLALLGVRVMRDGRRRGNWFGGRVGCPCGPPC